MTPRIQDLDVEVTLGQIALQEKLQRQRDEILRTSVSQHREQMLYYSSLSSHESIALLRYALGHAFTDVLAELEKCSKSCLKVFELREPWKDGMSGLHPMRGGHDFGTTSSKENLSGVCIALSAGKIDVAKQITELAWDPPDAYYITKRSEFCRPYDVGLAFALKNLLADELEESKKLLSSVSIPDKETRAIEMRELLLAMIAEDKQEFLDAFDRLLQWHESASWTTWPHEIMTFVSHYLCLWATGLSVLAISRGLIRIEDLPADNVYCPRELVAAAMQEIESSD